MQPIKILLIDDEKSTYDIINHYCKKNSKYAIDIEWYSEAPENTTNIHADSFELLLLDYHINQATGLDVLKALDKQQEDSGAEINLPVIMLSNLDDIQIAAEALHYGITEFIPKMNLSCELLNNTINNVIYKKNIKLQLIETNKRLEKSNQILKQQNDEINNFYQIISHELKTPLTSINEFINIILDGIAGEITSDQQEYLAICKKNCSQLAQYVNDLLDVGRISTNKYQLNKSKVNINNIITLAIKTSTTLSKLKNITLEFKHDKRNLHCHADETRIYQALLILINNAIKFSPQNGKIQIKANQDEDSIQISVTDNGCGIEQKHLDKIFDRLYQVENNKTSSSTGLGLGLFICKKITQLHQGKILVSSAPGKGSQFTLKFPYHCDINEEQP